MNRKRQRQLILLLTVVPALVCVVTAVVYIVGEVKRVTRHLDVVIVDELRRQTRRDVRIGGYGVSRLGKAVLKDIEISNGPTFRSGTLLRADELIVDYKFWDLVHRKVTPIQSIQSLRLVRPVIRLDRYRNGKLNINDFFIKRPGPKRPPFAGTIYFENGDFTYSDWQAKTPGPKPAVIRVKDFDGIFDASGTPFYVYNVTGRGPKGGNFDRLALSGSIDNRNGVVAIDVRAKGADAAFWLAYFANPGAVHVLGGRADVNMSVARKTANGKSRWSYTGTADIRDGRALITGFSKPADKLSGRIKIGDQRLDMRLKGSMLGSPFSIAGSIVNFARPGINLHIASRSVDFAPVLGSMQLSDSLKQVKVDGRGPLDLHIIGRSDGLAYIVRTSVPSVQALGYRARNVDVRATYSGDLLQIESARADALDGRISLGGTIVIEKDTTRLALSGTTSGVKLGMVPEVAKAGISGTANGKFELSGTASNPRLAADVKLKHGYFNNIAFNSAATQVIVTAKSVEVSALTAKAAGGDVQLSGRVIGPKMDFRAVAVGVDLARALAPFGMKGVSGVGNFDGTISGEAANPTVTGRVELSDGRVQDFSFDYARGNIVANKKTVEFKDTVVRIIPAEVTLAGRITGLDTKTPNFDLDVSVVDAPVGRLLREMKVTADVTGIVSGKLAVRGAGKKLQASGSISLSDGSIAGYPVSSAETSISYSGGALELSDFTAKSGETTFAASGTLDKRGSVDLTFAAKGVSLSEISEKTQPYVTLSGTADVSGKVSGPRANLSIAATVAADHPIINTVPFDEFRAEVAYGEQGMSVSGIVLAGPQGKIAIDRAEYDAKTEKLKISDGNLDSFSYPALYTLLSESPYARTPEAEGLRGILTRLRRPDDGSISGAFGAEGPVDDLQANVKLSAKKLDIAELKNLDIDLSASTSGGGVKIESLEARADSLYVRGDGTIDPKGSLNVNLDAYNVDLGALTSAIGPSYVTGTATVTASITGPVSTPRVTFSVNMVDPVIYGVKFDSLSTGLITVDGDTIDLSRVVVTKEDPKSKESHSGVIFGKVPWSWSKFTVPADRPIDLHASLEEQSLKILAILVDKLDSTRTSGTFSANVDIVGTLGSPNLAGSITVNKGTVGVVGMDNDFTNIAADVRFEGSTIRVAQLSGQSSGGGSFDVVPGGIISLANVISPVPGQSRSTTNLTVRAKSLYFAETNMLEYRERISGQISTGEAGVVVTGPVTHPKISGLIELAKADVLLGPVPEGASPKPITGEFNPAFDLTLSVGNDVWFNNRSSINALMLGQGRLTGTLRKPVLSANVKIARGWLRFPTQRMRITNGAVTVAWNPYSNSSQAEPPRVTVNLEAETSLSTTSPLGGRRRYNITMSVQGSLLSLEPEDIVFKSDPAGLSRTQILAALGHFEDIFGSGEVALNQQLRNVFTLAVSPYVLEPLESGFIEALGLEDFTIEYGFEQPLAVSASRELMDNVYVSYWSILNGTSSNTGSSYSLKLSYRLKDWLEIGYITDSRRIQSLEIAVSRRF